MDDLPSCDFDSLPVEPIGLPDDPWLARRMLSFGCSEIPALLIAVGVCEPTPITPRYVTDLARKLFGVKAGTRKPSKGGRAASVGADVELELLLAWNADTWSGYPPAVPSNVAPREWYPLVDRYCPRLSCTPDAWLHVEGELVNVQVKTDQHGGKKAPTREWIQQVQGEMAVTGSSRTVIVYGGGWACDWRDQRAYPVAFEVPRDDEMIEVIRNAAREGWAKVEGIRATMKAPRVA